MKKGFGNRFKEELGEAVLEIILCIVFLAIGAGVLAIFGVGADAEWLEFDTVVMIGVGVTAIAVAAVCIVVHISKKKKKNKSEQNSDEVGDSDKTKGE